MSTIKILLIEDDDDDYIITTDLFDEIFGDAFVVDWADTASAARVLFKDKSYDVCLMDYRLGPDTGVELIQEAREVGFDAPIIVLTGQKDRQIDTSASQAGADDYLLKSELDAEKLGKAIRYACSRKEVEREKIERLRAEEKNQLKSQFLAHLSHELRTPLTAILGFAESLSLCLDEPDYRRQADTIFRNGRHLLSLLNDILDLSRIESGRLELYTHQVDLLKLINDVHSLMVIPAEEKGLRFVVECKSSLPTTLETDGKRLKQILINLVNNAIKFTGQGQIVLRVNSEVVGDVPHLKFAVIDTGEGIEPSDMNKIFEAFEQGASTVGAKRSGTGLGLAISKQLTNLLGGELSIESKKGRGSTFTLDLPVKDVDISEFKPVDFASCKERGKALQPPGFYYSGRVLVVDDMRDLRNLARHMLVRLKLDVECAESGLQALKVLEESGNSHFDFILLDIDMPYVDGYQVLEEIRAKGYKKPVVAFTAALMVGDKKQIIDRGFDACLGKPLESVELNELVASLLTPRPEGPAFAGEKAELLIVDDDRDSAMAVAGLLTQLGLDVSTAFSSDEAVEAAKSHTFRLALVDFNLPDHNGLAIIKQLQSLQASCKYYILSGDEVGDAIAQQVDGAILKPIDLSKLKQILAENDLSQI